MIAAPSPARPSEKYVQPRRRIGSLATSTPVPASRPSVTRPIGPIQSLSNAYLRKNDIAMRIADKPMTFSHLPPMSDSMSRSELTNDFDCSGGAAEVSEAAVAASTGGGNQRVGIGAGTGGVTGGGAS